ncbi:MAG: hypothetical protein D6820_04540 [Lentisphaerae bacterium]|nr:MAG: hypothetical protein D6820_04540 [Lentisphaerota bacterium]
MLKNVWQIWLAALFCLSAALLHGSDKKEPVLDLGGVQLGMTDGELLKLAKAKRRQLVGPGKRIINHFLKIQVQDYVVAKDRQIVSISGCRRQTIMVLNHKVIAVELWFKYKSSLTKFLDGLKKLGFEEKEKDLYVGKIPSGPHAGLPVEAQVEILPGAKRSRKVYSIQIRCLKVLGEDITPEKIMRGQGVEPPPKDKGEALNRTI